MHEVINLPTVKLRYYQRDAWNALFVQNKKKILCVWHRRAGKDDFSLNALTAAAMDKVGYYIYLLPEQKQARKVIWHGINEEGKPFISRIPQKLIKRKSSVEMLVELVNGSIIQLTGSDNYNSLMGINSAGIIHSEFALSNPFARQYLRPILVKNGGWEIINSTPRGMNHLYQAHKTALANPADWYYQLLTVDDTFDVNGKRLISDDMVDSERHQGAREEFIQSEYYCSFEAAILGAYYAQQMRAAHKEKRIGEYAIDPSLPTFTCWDLGFNDATAIWIFQVKNGHFYFVKYYQNYGQTFEHYARYLSSYAQENKITFQAHIAPHDIVVTELFGTGKTRAERAMQYGINFEVVPRTKDVTEEIDEVRYWFPYFHFDYKECAEGLAALTEYHAEYKIDTDIFDNKPKHNWASHGADAMRTGIVWYSHQRVSQKEERAPMTQLFNPFQR